MKLTAAQEGNIDSTGITTDDYNNMHPTADNIERLKKYSGRLGRLLTLDLAQSAVPNFHTMMFLKDTDPEQHKVMLLTIASLKTIQDDNMGFTPNKRTAAVVTLDPETPIPHAMLQAADNHVQYKGYNLVFGQKHTAIIVNAQIVGFFAPRHFGDYWRTGAIYISPEHQRRGYATQVIKQFSRNKQVRAWITDDNLASQKAYTRAGLVRGEYQMKDGDAGHWYSNTKGT